MKRNSLQIPIDFDRKLILLSDITYYDNQKFPIFFRYKIGTVSDSVLLEIISTICEYYSNFKFWWLDGHEAAITLWERDFIIRILKIFEKLNIEDKIFLIDNNVGECEHSSYIKKFRVGKPCMIGLTSHMGFEITERKFEKKFISFNRIPKPHRREIFRFLKKNYYDTSYLSFAPNHPHDRDRLVFDEVEKIAYGNMLHVWPHEVQKTSFCNIVTESIGWSGPIHITEKIDKCFSAGQPFVLVAGSGYLKKLKEFGFKTFNKWWDESYDSEWDSDKRISKVKQTINYIGNLSIKECESIYLEMIPILKHNKELSKRLNNDIYMNYKWDNYETISFEEKKSLF